MGCLKAIAVRIGCLVIFVAVCIAVFVYREQIIDYYHAWKGDRGVTYTAAPAERPAGSPLRRLTERGGPAYVDLSAADIAALVDSAVGSARRQYFDSVQVALLEGEIRVRGSLDLRDVPKSALGPVATMLREREPAAIGGPLSVDSTGRLLLTVTYLRLREFPFPRSTIPRILTAAHLPGAANGTVPLPIGIPIGDVRVTPQYVRLYRAAA